MRLFHLSETCNIGGSIVLDELEKRKRLVLPTLILSISSIDPPSLIIGMSLIEIASSFGVSVGLAAQIRSITSIMVIAVASAMGVLSVRYSYKNLLLTGLLINLISAICCSARAHVRNSLASANIIMF